MKKHISILLALVLVMALCLPTVAAVAPKVVDDAGILLSNQRNSLEILCLNLASAYGIDVVIVTTDSTGYQTATQYADDYFDFNSYGIGSDASGVLLLLDLGGRNWAVSTHGDAIRILTDRRIDNMMYDVSEYFTNGDYYDGFSLYLQHIENYFEADARGTPLDEELLENILIISVVSLIVGLVAAGAVILYMRSKMNTSTQQKSAQSYLNGGSFHLKTRQDIYLYSTVTKVRKSENNGSSTHRSSSGRSHGGRSGRF